MSVHLLCHVAKMNDRFMKHLQTCLRICDVSLSAIIATTRVDKVTELERLFGKAFICV